MSGRVHHDQTLVSLFPSSGVTGIISSRAILAGMAIWLTMVSLGLGMLTSYGLNAGAVGNVAAELPDIEPIRPQANQPTLIMFAHPRCPCTRASLGELEKLVARWHGELTVYVVFIRPAGTTAGWERSDLWDHAIRIPNVKVLVDEDAALCHRFGARTSGETLMYGVQGELLFRGGITAARGHSGDNRGVRIIDGLLNHQSVDQVETPVFGCPLFSIVDTAWDFNSWTMN